MKFDNFSDFQNVISHYHHPSPTPTPSPSFVPERHYDALHAKIDMWLTPYLLLWDINEKSVIEMILQDMLKNDILTTSRECHGVDVHFEIFRGPWDVSKWYKNKQTNF